jgi:hypothetical protein
VYVKNIVVYNSEHYARIVIGESSVRDTNDGAMNVVVYAMHGDPRIRGISGQKTVQIFWE